VMRFIRALRALGCRFALDDFGTGLSSFAYLRILPIDVVKIDGMFVERVADDPIDREIVDSINRIGHLMGKETVAERVEDAATMTVLREIGIDYVQGFGIEPPRRFDAQG